MTCAKDRSDRFIVRAKGNKGARIEVQEGHSADACQKTANCQFLPMRDERFTQKLLARRNVMTNAMAIRPIIRPRNAHQ